MAKFSVGARAIDLLGRQQVAGTPTAISELFKNAHDAYADRVQVDYFRARDLLVLRDDGVGMTRAEFETRWLTAATDSKRNDAFTDPPPVDPEKPRRPVMGEKGIGRLAIAVLGAQVLILTRSKGAGLDGGVTACFIHWGVFSLPMVTLGDIDLAVEEFPAGAVPRAEDVGTLVSRSIASVETLRRRTDAKAVDQIVADMKGFSLDPDDLSGTSAGELGLVNGFGTHFYVAPVRPEIASDIDGYDRSKRATSIQKVLIGFYNTMLPESPEPVMTTSFKDHKPNVDAVDLIGEQEFFTPGDFKVADHRIEGVFDARGQFSGTIEIYGQEARRFQTHWPDGNGKDTRCGPFKLSLAYVQGVRADSGLPDDAFESVTEKLTKYGGLYMYRDGIRILPYGDSDYDFLDFEQRRSRSASYYFFSYRRMFGVLDVTREFNSGLVEKAGREGFQENTAYKQFKSILEHFFVQTAAVFFRKDGTEAEQFFRKEEELNQRHALLEKRRKQVGPQRGKLKADLTSFLDAVAAGTFRREADAIVTAAVQGLVSATEDSMTVAALRTIERDARRALDDIDDRGRIVKPRAVGLTRDLTNLWARYEVERRRLVEEVLVPARRELAEAVMGTTDRLNLAFDRRGEALGRLGERVTRENQVIRAKARKARTGADSAIRKVTEVVSRSVRTFEAESTAKLVEFEGLDFAGMSEPEFTAAHERLDADLLAVAAEQVEHLDQLLDQVSRLGADDGASDSTLAALETELEDRRERETESLRLAQMGLAIGIVHHEFHAVTRSVSASIGRLARWAERNPKLGDVYRQIAESYAHLDSYLGLFAPLNRRLGQAKRLIDGQEIAGYLGQLLGDRMRRHGVEMACTPSFATAEIEEYAATIFPCFVNMADNAVFWMDVGAEVAVETGDEAPSDRPKVLTLDFVDGAFVMSDTGPGVLPADEGAVFESGFSRKPGGSGLGLHITKSLLERSGYSLTLDPYVRGRGATFRIKPPASAIPTEMP